jgi:transposase InsO family protein
LRKCWVPRDHWLTAEEAERIRAFARAHPLEGYRRMAFMMLDSDVVACSPSSVYRVLKRAGLLHGSAPHSSKKGTGYLQPLRPHQEWHIDVSHVNIAGTFYYLCSILDGYSRFIVHGEIRDNMRESDIQTILQRARELYPGVKPRIISDNGPQFVARDFKEFIRVVGMTHVRTSPYYPQSNGKLERYHRSLKSECIRTKVPLSLKDAQRLVAQYVVHYNNIRLNSAIGYVAPRDRLLGRDAAIHAERDRKLVEARLRRQEMRAAKPRSPAPQPMRAAIDFAAVRQTITIGQVLTLLGFRARSDHAGQQRGACPIHGASPGTARCFSVNTKAHTFYCFKCGRSGNHLDLWAIANRLSIHNAATDLCQRLNLPLPTANREEEPVSRSIPNSDTMTPMPTKTGFQTS